MDISRDIGRDMSQRIIHPKIQYEEILTIHEIVRIVIHAQSIQYLLECGLVIDRDRHMHGNVVEDLVEIYELYWALLE